MAVLLASEGLFPEYPKIETVFDRDPANMKRVLDWQYRCEEFRFVNRWLVTEKIDGTNVRVGVATSDDVFYGGRTDDAQLPPFLLDHLARTLPIDVIRRGIERINCPVTIYGEGYGHRIQRGGSYRSEGVSFRVFDIRVGDTWLAWETVKDLCAAMGVETAPEIGVLDTELALAEARGPSSVALAEGGAPDAIREGVIAKSHPLMLDRMGRRIMWKLKTRDLIDKE